MPTSYLKYEKIFFHFKDQAVNVVLNNLIHVCCKHRMKYINARFGYV